MMTVAGALRAHLWPKQRVWISNGLGGGSVPAMYGHRPNVSHAKLHGQGPRGVETSGAAAAAAPVSIRADAICSRRDAVQVLFDRAASAADRSRAVTASA